MKVILAPPRGFHAGVVRAIEIVERIAGELGVLANGGELQSSWVAGARMVLETAS